MARDVTIPVDVGPAEIAQERKAGQGGAEIVVQVLGDARALALQCAFLLQVF